MKDYAARDSSEAWTSDIPPEIKSAIDSFVATANEQIEVALALK